jgi:plasmid stabilization system protein ParE
MKFSFHPLAQRELHEAIDYYNECQEELGIEFAKEVHQAIQVILPFPQAWSPLSKNTRRCIVSRFPYGVIYQAAKDELIIIAIAQLNKKPGYWNDRITS